MKKLIVLFTVIVLSITSFAGTDDPIPAPVSAISKPIPVRITRAEFNKELKEKGLYNTITKTEKGVYFKIRRTVTECASSSSDLGWLVIADLMSITMLNWEYSSISYFTGYSSFLTYCATITYYVPDGTPPLSVN